MAGKSRKLTKEEKVLSNDLAGFPKIEGNIPS